jgi:hypothetical protein
MKKFFLLREEACPVATQNLDVNVKNRQHAIDEYHYGPANPNEPGSYWKDAAKIWGIDEKTAMTMKCENCAAFDISDKMRDCIDSGMKGDEESVDAMATINKSDLGYCNILHFKCAGTRSCSVWLTNGPIDDKDLT